MLSDRDEVVAEAACRLYQLTFAIASEDKGGSLFGYLAEELRMLSNVGLEHKADPLLSKLTEPERERMWEG